MVRVPRVGFTWAGGAALAAGSLVATLLLGLLVPIYTDEVAWRYQARAAVDGVDRFIGVNCGPNTLAVPPFFMMPLRHFSAAVNAALDDPLYVRLAGVGLALAWAALFWLLAGRIAGGREEAHRLRIIGFSLLGLGVLPFLLVLSRPEQPLLICITLALLVASRRWGESKTEDDSPAKAALVSAAVLLIGLVAISYHLKGILYAPVFVIALFAASRGRGTIVPRVVAAGLFGACAFVALRYWVDRFACPGDPLLAAQLAKENAATLLLTRDLAAGVAAWLSHGVEVLSPLRYLDLVTPAPRYMSDWLPPGVVSIQTYTLWAAALRVAWGFALLAVAAAGAMAVMRLVRDRRVDRRLLLGLALAGIVIGWGLMQITKNSYESALALPASVLAFLLILSAAPRHALLDRLVRQLSVVLLVLAVGSQIALFAFYARPLWQAAATPGYLAAQRFSYSPYGYRTLEQDIAKAGEACGFRHGTRPRALLIDDLTYLAYQQSWRPLHRNGVLNSWNGTISDPVAYLRSQGSTGLMIGCAYLPPEVRARAKRSGQFCCLNLSPGSE